MKKNGFTLAEVLITLAIIGVVATMTLPALMNNSQEQQAKTGLKKAVNTLTEAVQMNQSIDGFDYASAKDGKTVANIISKDDLGMSLAAILVNRTSIDYGRLGKTLAVGASGDAPYGDGTNVVFFKDGSALIYNPTTAKADATNASLSADGLAAGYPVVIDTNGLKGPNILSNCAGNALGSKDEENVAADGEDEKMEALDVTACNDKAKRVIKDQFVVQLRGNIAVPGSAAAQWAFEN